MKNKELKTKYQKNQFTTANILSEDEFKKGLKDAENGRFTTVQESMSRFESWLQNKDAK